MVGRNRLWKEPSDDKTLSRRETLGVISTGMVALAGCSGGEGGSDPATTTTTTTTSTTTTKTTKPEPTFELREVNVPKIAQKDEDLSIQLIIANIGETSGEPTVSASLGPLQQQKTLQAIEPGNTKTPSLSMSVSAIDPGRYSLTVKVEDQSLESIVDVWEPIEEPGVYGSVISEAGSEISNSYLSTIATMQEKREFPRVRTDPHGKFSFSHPFQSEYRVSIGFEKEALGSDNGIPPTWGFVERKQVSPGEIALLDRFELPEAYRTQIRLVDESGSPISDFSGLGVRGPMGYGTGPRRLTTDKDGYVIGQTASEPGICLPSTDAGKFTIEGYKPDGPGERFGEIYGSQSGETFKFTVENPEAFGISN